MTMITKAAVLCAFLGAFLGTFLAFQTALSASADEIISGNYELVSGSPSDCPATLSLHIDPQSEEFSWPGEGWKYTNPQNCEKDQSQLDTPQDCWEVEFGDHQMTLTETDTTYIFGILPGNTTTETTQFDFSDDYGSLKITDTGNGEYSPNDSCAYRRGQ